jgi:predicted outer membrane repeat protein
MSVICPTMLTDCIFTGNSAAWDGGAIYAVSTTFENCIFSGNRVLEFRNDILGGGAVHIPGTAMFGKAVTINNCTFIKNWSEFGCAISYFGLASMNNCILRGSENQIYEHFPYGAPSFVRYSNVQGGWEGEGNIDVDPLFVDPGYWAHIEDPNLVVEPNEPNAVWVDGDYHLKSQAGRWDPNSESWPAAASWVQDYVTSPCIDTGDPNRPIDPEPFPNGSIINMGAYGGTVEASKSYFNE